MAIYCGKCSLAVKTSLWFDNEADAKCHRESKLHAAVSSDSESRLLQDFRKHLVEDKPKKRQAQNFRWRFSGSLFCFSSVRRLMLDGGNTSTWNTRRIEPWSQQETSQGSLHSLALTLGTVEIISSRRLRTLFIGVCVV